MIRLKLLCIFTIVPVLVPVRGYPYLSLEYGLSQEYDRKSEKRAPDEPVVDYIFGFSTLMGQHRITNGINYSFGHHFDFNKHRMYLSGLAWVAFRLLEEPSAKPEILLLALMPDHINFHFWLMPYWDVTLALHPCGSEYYFSGEQFYYTNAVAITSHTIFNNYFALSPFVRYKYVYTLSRHILEWGLKVELVY